MAEEDLTQKGRLKMRGWKWDTGKNARVENAGVI